MDFYAILLLHLVVTLIYFLGNSWRKPRLQVVTETVIALAIPFCGVLLMVSYRLCCLLLATACREVPAVDLQPAKDNTLKESLIDANRHIAHSEETQIDAYASRRGWKMSRLPSGTRVMLTHRGQGTPVEYEDTVAITYSVEALNGATVYSNVCDTVVVGRLQPTRGVDAALRTLRRGDRARLILPSEQAYGVLGDGHRITTRMVLIYDITINQQ